jgi:hypothetical protein
LASLLTALALTLAPAAPLAPASASADQSARLHVTLSPERLGGRTTIIFSFRIIPQRTLVPSPLVAMDLLYPAGIGLITSGLGLETCAAQQLEALGRCAPDSLMGYGSALGEAFLGSEVVEESVRVTTWMAPVQNGHVALLLYAEGYTPTLAESIFSAEVLEAAHPYGGELATNIPLQGTWPGGPDISVVQMTATIGPKNVTYYAKFRGKRVAYRPNGVRLPDTCPHGGFPFAATFTFLDGSQASASTAVPCPSRRRRAAR